MSGRWRLPVINLGELKLHGLPLGGWFLLGLGLRLTNLTSKPPWSDEWATLVFSSGHSFQTLPLDQLLTATDLLAPARSSGSLQFGQVITHLLTESNHPPLYFLLTHGWLHLFDPPLDSPPVGLVRALSVFLGTMAIPAMFGWGWLTFRSSRVGHLAAALMAVSPFGIYLAQEGRHYTLAILWLIGSLCCLVVAVQGLRQRHPLPWPWILLWVGVNSGGLATHYFVLLTLVAEVLVLALLWLQEARTRGLGGWWSPRWRRIYAAIAGTVVIGLFWIPVWQLGNSPGLTSWIYHGNPLGQDFWAPIGRLLAWLITMVALSPVEGVPIGIAIILSLMVLGTLVGLIPALRQGLRQQQPWTQFCLCLLGGIIGGCVALVLGFTYGLGIDLTLAARYQFILYPAFLMVLAGILSPLGDQPEQFYGLRVQGQDLVIVLLGLGLLGSSVVVGNWGYQKADRPDLVALQIIQAAALNPSEQTVLIATAHKTHEQTGEMMGLAWMLQKRGWDQNLQFLLAHKDPTQAEGITETLQQIVAELPRPLDVWLINFSAPKRIEAFGCVKDPNFAGKAPGYHYDLYHCSGTLTD